MFDSAIPPHLSVERTLPTKTPPDYEPPFPAYSARFPEKTKDIVMAILGAQARQGMLERDALKPILGFLAIKNDSPPLHVDIASVVDTSGVENRTAIAYWNNKSEYLQWAQSSGFENWWQAIEPASESHGWFREVFFPPVDRFETVFSDNNVPEGAAHMREGVSGQIREHVYWGSARDRLAVAQTDTIGGEKYRPDSGAEEPQNDTTKQRIKIDGKPNMCVIRSGQDWTATKPEERTLYLKTMHPVLKKGMDFLRDHGTSVGCYSCRFMTVLDSATFESQEKTFGLAYFDDLDSLEKWSREHKTHLDIFQRFLKYAQELNNEVSLRLFHEILILKPEQQDIEYIGCHKNTGFLAAASKS